MGDLPVYSENILGIQFKYILTENWEISCVMVLRFLNAFMFLYKDLMMTYT